MAKKITIDIEVNGKMQKATVSASKLRSALEGVEQASDKVSRSARETDRNIKGTANASSNASKNFSKMQQGMGGLVGAYASLAASLFAVSAAFNFLKSAGELKSLQAGQVAYASATGVAIKTLTQDIIAATEAQIQFRDAAQATAIGTAAGLNADQLTRLATAAKDASQILGRDVTDSFNRLIRGATKAEPELLDELGIILRLDTATQNYKRALNITGRELTAFERTQAVTNEILSQSESKYSEILDIVGRSPNQYAQLGKAFDDIIMKVKEVVDQIVGPFAKVLQETPALGIAALGLLLSGPLSALGLSFGGIAEKAQDAAEKQQAFYRGVQDEVKKARKTADDFKRDLQGLARVGMADGAKAGFLDKMASGKAFNKADIARFTAAVDAAENHVNSSGVVVKGAFTGMKIHMVREMREAYMNMDAAQAGTLAKTETFALRMKALFSGIAASAKTIAASIATVGSRLINAIGIIGMVYTFYEVFKGIFGDKQEITDEQKEAARLQQFTTRLQALNDEYKNFIEIQSKLTNPGSNKFYRSMAGFLGSQTQQDVRDMATEFSRLGNTMKRTERNGMELMAILASIGAGGFAGGVAGSFIPGLGTATGAVLGAAGAAYAMYTGQESGRLSSDGENLGQNAEDNERINAIKDRFGAIQAAIQAAGEESKTTYFEFDRLNNAISAFMEDPKDEALQKAMFEAYQGAQLFGQELEATVARTKLIKEQIQGITQKYAPVSAEEQAADTIQTQIDELNKEKDSISTPFGSPRYKAILNQISGLEKQQTILREIDSADHDIKMRELRFQIRKDRGLEGETQAEKRIRDLKNQQLQIEDRMEKLRTRRNAVNQSARLAMNERGFEGSLQDFLASSAGTEFQRQLDVIRVELDIANLDFNEVETSLNRALTQPLRDAEMHRSKLVTSMYDLSKQMLGFKQQELAAQKAILETQRQQDEIAIDTAMRTHRLTNPFYWINEDEKRAQLELDTAKKRKDEILDGIEAERQIKIDMIRLETLMLKERRRIALLELRAAQSKLDPDSTLYKQFGDEISLQEGATDDFNNRLDRAESAQITAANEEAKQRKAATEEEIAAKEYALELTNQLRMANEEAMQSLENNLTNAFAGLIDGSMNAKEAFRSLANSMIQDISRIIAKLLVQKAIMAAMNMLGGLFGAPTMSVASTATARAGAMGSAGIDDMINSIAGMRYGGISKKGYSSGGIARGSDAGYLAKLHGTEAVVPLPNGRSIPVEMSGAGAQTNNVSVSVNINNDGSAETTTEDDAKGMGKAIAAAVQREIQHQKRPGGMLSPYGGTR